VGGLSELSLREVRFRARKFRPHAVGVLRQVNELREVRPGFLLVAGSFRGARRAVVTAPRSDGTGTFCGSDPPRRDLCR